MKIVLQLIMLALGFAMLVKGADFFVDGAASIAAKFKIPQLIIGLTVVAMGTSAPEAAVSISAAFSGNAKALAVVQVPAGSTVVCEVGVQAVLRVGQAVCVAAGSPGLIDLSNGETLANGGALAANHLYTASIQGRGIYTAQGCTLLIAGSYNIQ